MVRILIVILCLLWASAAYAVPTTTTTIDPTATKWTEDWSDATMWDDYGTNFVSGNLHYDATIGNYFTAAGGGSPHKRWDKNKSITARLRLIRNGANWIGFSLFAGESEYCGFSINSGGSVGFYNNAAYTYPSNFTATNGQAVELQIEFDGNQTHVYKARNYDPTDTAAWTTIGTQAFKPTVHPTIQANQEGTSGTVLYGQIDVTGSEVWGYIDVQNASYWTMTTASREWGIEFNSGADYGLTHYLTLAGGLTRVPVSGASSTWIQGVSSTAYNAGDFQGVSSFINPAAGYKYDKLELIGALRQGGAGSTLSVSIKKSDGTLVPSGDLGGASNPVTFTTAAATQKTVDLSGITYTGIYLEVNGHVTNSTTKNWPDATGTTGPPILKEAAITFTAEGGSVAGVRYLSTLRCNFK